MTQSPRLGVTNLEDRSTPATFGVPWADPNLSLSFAPDGTAVAGRMSTLFSDLNNVRSENEWQTSILRAFHTWSAQTGLDIAVVPDAGGHQFGTPGRLQNDPRFGDIRIGGNRMSTDVLAVASPSDPALSGTLAGDVFINSRYRFDGSPYDLYSVMLHEAGHALGLDHSADLNSPMYPRFYNTRTGLTAGDITAIRNLYGTRQPDRFEGTTGNGTFATASGIPVPTAYTGATPLLAFGDLMTAADTDIHYFDTVLGRGENHNVTVRLQSAGVSLLGAKVSIYWLENGVPKEVANVKSDSADYAGDTLEVTFDGNDDDDFTSRRYYVKVEAADDAPFRSGRYGVAVTFDGENAVPPTNLDQVIRGPHRTLGPNDLAALLQNPTALVNVDAGGNDTAATATPAEVTAAFNGTRRHEAVGSLVAADIDVYSLTAPAATTTRVLTANVWALPGAALAPRVEVLDAAGAAYPAEVLVNDSGSYTVQATGLLPGAPYYVRVTGTGVGNYFLTADFGGTATEVVTFAGGELAAGATLTDTVYVGQSQLFHFMLTPGAAPVRMTVTDAAGVTVFDVTATGGTTTGPAVWLRPGEYRVRYTALSGPTTFTLRGNRITDPVGPVVDDPTLDPTYRDPNDPNRHIYPPNVSTTDPYYWVRL